MEACDEEVLDDPERKSVPMPIVVDTNVLIDGVISLDFKKERKEKLSAAGRILLHIFMGNCQLISIRNTREEFMTIGRAMKMRGRKKPLTGQEIDFVRRLFNSGKSVRAKYTSGLLPTEDNESGDKKFIVAARRGQARCIVSGDRHLLKLPSHEGFYDLEVLTPEEFLAEYERQFETDLKI